MPNIHEINTAVYRLLAGDETLAGTCAVYKGEKRPVAAGNPSVTVHAESIEPDRGEGMWRCRVRVTAYADVTANRMPDHPTHELISGMIDGVLTDAVLELEEAKALPLVKTGSTGLLWDGGHGDETRQESTFELVFVKFS